MTKHHHQFQRLLDIRFELLYVTQNIDCELSEYSPEASLMSDMYVVMALGMEYEDVKKMK